MTLLEKAKAEAIKKLTERCTQEDIDLCLSWCRGEVGGNDIAKVKGMPQGGGVYAYIAQVLKLHILKNMDQ